MSHRRVMTYQGFSPESVRIGPGTCLIGKGSEALVSRVYADASAWLLFNSLQGSQGFQVCWVGRRMEEKEN